MADIHDAVEFAAAAHRGQCRKGTSVPYLIHPLGAAAILLDAGCQTTLAIAAVLHDTMEDAGVTHETLQARFGREVADLVRACSEPDKGDTWENRKKHTIEFLQSAPEDVLLVSLSDKLDNVRAMRQDLAKDEEGFWKRFRRPRIYQRWYYAALADVFAHSAKSSSAAAIAADFSKEVELMFPRTGSHSTGYVKADPRSPVVSWSDIRPVAEEAFMVFRDQPELFWAELSWTGLADVGLASYENDAERIQVIARFLALATVYYDWCHIAWTESIEDDAIWRSADGIAMDEATLSYAHTRIHPQPRPTAETPNPERRSRETMLAALAYHEREGVVKGLVRSWGGEDALFKSLYMSTFTPLPPENSEETPAQQQAEAEKEPRVDSRERAVAAREWVEEGCYPLVDSREWAEPDPTVDEE